MLIRRPIWLHPPNNGNPPWEDMGRSKQTRNLTRNGDLMNELE